MTVEDVMKDLLILDVDILTDKNGVSTENPNKDTLATTEELQLATALMKECIHFAM